MRTNGFSQCTGIYIISESGRRHNQSSFTLYVIKQLSVRVGAGFPQMSSAVMDPGARLSAAW